MSLMLVSRHEPYPLLLDKYVVSYKVILSIPEDSLAKNYENVNDLYIELEVPKSEYKNEQVQEIIRWSRLPARDPHYYRDIAIHLVVMGGFERSIVFSHGRISCERTADTEADFETIKIFVSQKEDRYEGVVFGTDLDATYAKAWEMLKPKPVKPANLVQASEIDGPIFNENDFDFSNINSVVDAGMVGDLGTSQKKVYTGRFIMINASNVQVLDHFDKSYDGKEYELPFYDSQSSEFLDKKTYTIKELYEKGYRISESREFSLERSKSDWLNYIPEDEIHDYRVCEITYKMQYASIRVDDGSDEKTFYGYLADDKPYDQLYGNAGYEAYVVDYEEMLKFMGFKNVVASELKITALSSMGTKISVPKAGYPGKPREYLNNLKLSVLVGEVKQLMQIELDETKKTIPMLVLGDSNRSHDVYSLTEEQKIFIATIFGETSTGSNDSGVAVANVIMNRLDSKLDQKGYWSKYKTVTDIIKGTGFDAYSREHDNTNSNYSQAMKYMNNPDSFEGYIKIPQFVDDLIKLCLPVYYGEVSDITDGSVYYYSPNLQAELHKNNPSLYKEYPVFLDEPVELVKIEELSNSDDFAFYRYK